MWGRYFYQLELMITFFQVAKVVRISIEKVLFQTVSIEVLVIHILLRIVVKKRVREVPFAVNVFLTLLAVCQAGIQVKYLISSEVHGIVGADVVLKL